MSRGKTSCFVVWRIKPVLSDMLNSIRQILVIFLLSMSILRNSPSIFSSLVVKGCCFHLFENRLGGFSGTHLIIGFGPVSKKRELHIYSMA